MPSRIAFVDFPGPRHPRHLLRLIHERAEVLEDPDDPQFLFYSVFGTRHLSFTRAVRIFYTGESIHPDFNICDYSFGFDWLDFGDRHVRAPNYLLLDSYRFLLRHGRTPLPDASRPASERRFCNYIYSNASATPTRASLFHAIHAYRHVDSPGKHLRTMSADIGRNDAPDWESAKIAFQKDYAFSIACENSSVAGYTTEKLVQALAAGTIPIYFGNPVVVREFNPARFINAHDFPTLDALVDRIREVDTNDSLFASILAEPFFPGGEVPAGQTPEAVGDRLAAILAQGPEQAGRRNNEMWGRIYQDRRRWEARSTRERLAASVRARTRRVVRGP